MKTLMNLYIDGDIKALAKAKGVNCSRICNEILAVEVGLLADKRLKTDKDVIDKLKLSNAKLSQELTKQKEINDKLNLEIGKLKAKIPTRKVLATRS